MKKALQVTFLFFALIATSKAFSQIETARHLIGAFDEGFWLVTVDFDFDGDPDIVAASRFSGPGNGLQWYENSGSGTFTKHPISTDFEDAWSIHAADIDGDGDMDAVACSEEGSLTSWFEQNPNGTFTEHEVDSESINPHSVWAADMDKDNDVDILVAVWEGREVVIWENDGNENFTANIIDGNSPSPHSISAADLDNDNDMDIMVGSAGLTNWYRNTGNGNFTKLTIGSGGAFFVGAFDINNDGYKDVVRIRRSFGLDWFKNLAGTGFDSGNIIKDVFGEGWSAAAGDFDRDGDKDVVAAAYVNKDAESNPVGPDYIGMYINDNLNFSEEKLEEFGTESGKRPRVVSVADIDKDGDDDIVALVTRTDELLWYEMVGSPTPVEKITVVSPNGGEVIEAGSTFPISWTSDGELGKIKIEYSANNGTAWSTVSDSTDNDDNFLWNVPLTQTTLARLRLTSVKDTSISDLSDAVFTIVTSTLTITSPNGGESFQSPGQQTITWTSTGLVTNVKLEYSLDNGGTWTTIIANTPNSGSYNWSFPDLQSTQVLVRISDAADGIPTDTSNSVFSIVGSSLTLTSPNGGEVWPAGTSHNIQWNSTGTIGFVKIEYSTNNGTTWQEIVSLTANNGIFGWQVPDVNTNQALVRISDANDGNPADVSNSTFSIVGSSIVLTSPNGGETLLSGSIHTIKWNFTGSVGTVRIELSVNNGSTWSLVQTDVPNTGTYNWTVPFQQTTQARIRISDALDNDPTDASDAVFSILPATINVLSPNGGENWYTQSRQLLRWSSTGPIDSVKIELIYNYSDNAYIDTIAASTVNDGEYEWKIPNSYNNQNMFRIKISNAANNSIFDVSDENFSLLWSNLTLTAPNGGEQWHAGSTQQITWETEGTIDSVQIAVANVATWSDSVIIANIPNTGSYDWTIPQIQIERAVIRIFDLVHLYGRYEGTSFAWDVSDSTFTIIGSGLTITAPNGGETWVGGTLQTITWGTSGTVQSVNIFYSLNSGLAWLPISSNQPNTGRFDWFVPNILSLNVRVRVTSSTDNTVTDVSDGDFNIIRSTLTVTAPNGGEAWQAETSQRITWHSTGIINSVDIEYSPDNGQTWIAVISNTPNDGVYDWFVEEFESDSVLVKISNTSGGLPSDVSDTMFKIIPNVASVQISKTSGLIPDKFDVSQNYPNPFNMDTKIDFAVPNTAETSIKVYSITGKLVRTLIAGRLPAGVYSISWDGRDERAYFVTSGIYIYHVQVGANQMSRKMTIVK